MTAEFSRRQMLSAALMGSGLLAGCAPLSSVPNAPANR